jgi:hypothetical protein
MINSWGRQTFSSEGRLHARSQILTHRLRVDDPAPRRRHRQRDKRPGTQDSRACRWLDHDGLQEPSLTISHPRRLLRFLTRPLRPRHQDVAGDVLKQVARQFADGEGRGQSSLAMRAHDQEIRPSALVAQLVKATREKMKKP